ncbi:hypothetical protein DFH09DRAFT_1414443 [Mycena vulgaris]|nr:hypothetical protein DFH09DRAFT_1414443 [Mycena vulgaris]
MFLWKYDACWVMLDRAASFPQDLSDFLLLLGFPTIHPLDTSDDRIASYFMAPPAIVDIRVVLGVLKLAHKYDVDYVFRRALQHLSSEYPCDISVVTERSTAIAQKDDHLADMALHSEVIKVATEVNALWVLPPRIISYAVAAY